MDTKTLMYFRRIYECKSMNKASGSLFMTPQGLSKAMANLEQEVGAELFVKSRQGVSPTPAGTFLYEKSGELMGFLEEIEFSIAQIARKNQMLRIGNACGTMNVIPFWKLRAFEQENPDLTIYMEENFSGAIRKKVESGELDVGVMTGPSNSGGLVEKALVRKDICLFVYRGHPFYSRESVSFRELKGQPMITLNEQFYCCKVLHEGCMRYGFAPEIAAKTMEHRVIISSVRRRMGIGIDVRFSDSGEDREDIRIIPITEKPKWDVKLIYKKECGDFPNIQKLIRYIESASSEKPSGDRGNS